MTALICGSMAYDTVMVFEGRFREHILPDRIHLLNVSFLAPSMRRNFGGCAGNIAYNLKLLGGEGLIMATVGHDFAPYESWLTERASPSRTCASVPDEFTAQAFITTDLDDNQITAFHPGAMNHAHLNRVSAAPGVRLGIISPDGRQGMLEHAEQFTAAGIPYLFDPGQGLPMFDGEELRAFVTRAAWVAVNDYEASLLSERTGWSAEAIAARVKALIVTRGGAGSWIYAERPAARDSAGQGGAGGRPDRLWRCLPGWPALRPATGARLADDRPRRLAGRCYEDRTSRDPATSLRLGRPLPRDFAQNFGFTP